MCLRMHVHDTRVGAHACTLAGAGSRACVRVYACMIRPIIIILLLYAVAICAYECGYVCAYARV